MNTINETTDGTGPLDGLGQADILPAADLRPDAEAGEIVDVVNRQSKLLRAVQRMRGEGGVRVMFASEGLLIAGGPGNVGGENAGGGGSGGSGTGTVGENTGGEPVVEDDGSDVDGEPVDYDDLAEPYTPPGGSTLVYSVRQRTVTAELGGYSEFVASTPPRKYTVATTSGSIGYQLNGVGTTGPFDAASSQSIYPVTLVTTGTLYEAFSTCMSAGFCSPLKNFSPDWLNGVDACSTYLWSFTQTATTRTFTPTGVGYNTCGGGDAYAIGSGVVALSAEDTEEAAIGRAIGTWGDWATLVFDAEIAETEERGAGDFTMTATEAEVEVVVTGFDPDITVTVIAYLTRRALDGSTVEAWETRFYPMSINSGGAGDVTFSVTAESGYAVGVAGIGYLT